ncbi:MAG: ATP-binding protein [Bacteroides sp.]
MKRYATSVLLHILLIAALSIGCYLLFCQQLWFSLLLTALLLLGTGVHLYFMQMKQIVLMRRLTESIRFNDMTQTFHPPFKNHLMTELAEELSLTLKSFRAKLLEEEVKHQYYENLLNKVDTAVLVADQSGRVEWMNHAALIQLGQVLQLPDVFQKALMNRETQVVRFTRNGTTQELAVSATLFVARGSQRLLISLKNIHSVLERNEMEAWQKLIRVLTHEIMNSITPIISLSETLTDRGIPAQLGEKEYAVMLQAMQTIHRRSKGLLDFVENYRRLTRIPEPVCSKVAGSDLLGDLKKLFSSPDIRYELPEKEIILCIDRSQIEQVLINLLKNAQEACSRKSEAAIVVKLKQTLSKTLLLTISDNGEGILPEVVDKIFVPFFTTKSSGSGIGLSLCKQIMNLHGGSISVRSEVGVGSCFTLTFPI